MASEKDSEKKIVKPVKDGSSDNVENQFGEASSVDKVTLNNKIISMRSTVKKSKVRILAKLIRHIKQLKQKIDGKPVNIEKNKRKHTNLVQEMKVVKALKADTVSRFVLGNTCTFVELNNKGFQSIEARALARFSDEKLLQDIVEKFRAEHSDWKSLAAFVQTQSSGRHIKKKKKKKTNKLKKEGTKTNIKAKQAMVSTFLDGKVNINSIKEDLKSEPDINISHMTNTKSSQNQKKMVSNKNKQPVGKNLQPINSEPPAKQEKSDSDVCSATSMKNLNKEIQKSKQKHNSPDTSSTKNSPDTSSTKNSPDTSSTKNSKKELSSDKQQNVMVVKKINLNNFEEDILIHKAPAMEGSADSFGNDNNQNTEGEFFFFKGQESTETKEEKEEVDQKNDNDSEFTISGNHSIFLSLSDRDTPSFRGRRGTKRMNFHPEFKRPNFQRHQNSDHCNNFARGSFSNRGRKEKASSYPLTRTFKESRDTNSRNTDKQKLSDKSNLSDEKLHPSWEASRKRKEQAASISAFQGKKIKFDD